MGRTGRTPGLWASDNSPSRPPPQMAAEGGGGAAGPLVSLLPGLERQVA